VYIALTGLKSMLTELSNMVLTKPRKEWVFEPCINTKLVVGLGKE